MGVPEKVDQFPPVSQAPEATLNLAVPAPDAVRALAKQRIGRMNLEEGMEFLEGLRKRIESGLA